MLIGNPLTLTVIEFFAVPGALLGAALYPLGLDAPVWLYVGAGIKFILWAAWFIAAPGSTVHVRAFAPFALPFLALAVMSATIWRTWVFRASAIPFAIIGLIGAAQGPRYDVIVAPSGDQAAVRDADGLLEIVGKRFNAFAAEQWLTADADGRDPASARDAYAPCDRLGCVAALPEGESLSIVIDPLAFDEDCERAEVIVSALNAPANCRAKCQRAQCARELPGEIRARREGAGPFGRCRAQLERRHGLHDDERPLDPAEPALVARLAAGAGRPADSPRPPNVARRRPGRPGSGAGGRAIAEPLKMKLPAPGFRASWVR